MGGPEGGRAAAAPGDRPGNPRHGTEDCTLYSTALAILTTLPHTTN